MSTAGTKSIADMMRVAGTMGTADTMMKMMKRTWQIRMRRFSAGAGLLAALCAFSGSAQGALYDKALSDLPDVKSLRTVTLEIPMKIYTADGKLIGEFGESKRIPVPLEKITLKLRQRRRLAGRLDHHPAACAQFLFNPRENLKAQDKGSLPVTAYRADLN